MNLNFEQIKTLFSQLNHSPKNTDRLAAYQNRKLSHIIDHAYTHVPFYRTWLDKAKISPKEIRGKEDLEKIPLIGKENLKHQSPDKLIAQNFNPKRLGTFATSGSTGVPLVVRRSRFEDILFHLIRMQTILAYGLKRSDKFVRIRGSSNDEIPLSWKMVQKLGFYRQIMLSTFDPPEVLCQ
ncbi:MAG: hypothetical protein GQ544_08885, partial [Candidatus Aminicenantes bacterium]|nr:hypothetical protein [Candidatus Aminicenantes bacterium]